ncbi:MAG: CBS domain-containing protein [Planctomycetes bacterium]|nr:CBS domain-containing protein [Planctomycetota bacterium]MCA9311672.1 CBS domain-containing protein [Phycisphaerales bacterium]MCB9885590.1 CBS domain-containing protein [Planctomycetota bacterium]
MTVDLHEIRADEAMSKTVHWATPQENLRAAGQRMANHGIRALLVAGESPSDLPGVVTSKDIVNVLGTQSAEVLDQLQVRDVMTKPAICIPKQANLLDCVNLMRMAGVRRMPVLDGTDVIGILSMSDVFTRMLKD